jgi:PST family polysaccharide transporter
LATAPLVVAILLGKGFDAAVPVLRIFGAVLFMEAVGIALGVQWMLPLGLDKQFTAITVVAGLTNVALAWWLAGSYGEVGMVLAVLASHVTTAVGCFACLRLRGQDPFRRTESK